MNKKKNELAINKVYCPKCNKSRWKTVKKKEKVQCRFCGEVADYIAIEPVCKAKEPEKKVVVASDAPVVPDATVAVTAENTVESVPA